MTGLMAATQRMHARHQGFFSVFADAQTYKNLLFFLLVVPLGLLHAALIGGAGMVMLIASRLGGRLLSPTDTPAAE